jgi:ABC-type multidrug transport system permease subunit
MLTLAAVGGFFIPIIFGHLVPHSSFDTGWVFLAIVSFAFALVGLTGRNPATASKRPGAGTLAPVRIRAALSSAEVAED